MLMEVVCVTTAEQVLRLGVAQSGGRAAGGPPRGAVAGDGAVTVLEDRLATGLGGGGAWGLVVGRRGGGAGGGALHRLAW